MLLESLAHSQLRAFLRSHGETQWPHHLTMARLVARALRLGRSALIQTGSQRWQYCLSYLIPALVDNTPVIIVTCESGQKYLLETQIPRLQKWLQTNKPIKVGFIPSHDNDFSGVMLISPQDWLEASLKRLDDFPLHITTLIDGADNLETWTREQLTTTIKHQHWDELINSFPQEAELIRNIRVKITKAIFNRPPNPYECYLIEEYETNLLINLLTKLATAKNLNPTIFKFWLQIQEKNQILWASVVRKTGQLTINISPADIATSLEKIWHQQAVVLIASFLENHKNAPIYRQKLGIDDVTCIKFSPNPNSECLELYLSEGLPLPNTSQFQSQLMEKLNFLLNLTTNLKKPAVLLIEDVPLKAIIGTKLAAEFGSRVRVETTNLPENGILVSGWDFWLATQSQLPIPQMLVIATLPIPSLENPLIAAIVTYYKRQRQDWFRMYLLPTALIKIQKAILPLRKTNSLISILDNRVNHRSYGRTILNTLEPCSKINYLDSNWFDLSD